MLWQDYVQLWWCILVVNPALLDLLSWVVSAKLAERIASGSYRNIVELVSCRRCLRALSFIARHMDTSVLKFPRMLAPARGGRSRRFLMTGGKNWFWTSWKMEPL